MSEIETIKKKINERIKLFKKASKGVCQDSNCFEECGEGKKCPMDLGRVCGLQEAYLIIKQVISNPNNKEKK
jgi:hypothetical protein